MYYLSKFETKYVNGNAVGINKFNMTVACTWMLMG